VKAIHSRSKQRSVPMFCALILASQLMGCPRHLTTDQAAEQTRAMSSGWSDDLPQDGSLTVSLRALLVTAKSERPIVEQETLHAGDHLYFLLRTSQPAYLYVVLFGPDGEASVLFPRDVGSGTRVAARCPIRVPSQGSFYLQHPAGLQDLRVVASTEPLAQSDPRLCEQLRLPCEKMKPEPVPQCPQEQARALFSALKVATAVPGTGTGAVASLRLLLTQEP
jgi:hypothetical protein